MRRITAAASGNYPAFSLRLFYCVRDYHQDGIQGNRVGLAIVKSNAERHGGSVGVESQPG